MNMSLGGARSNALNAAIDELTSQGIVSVVAAGNENVSFLMNLHSCLFHPNTFTARHSQHVTGQL